MSSPTSVSTANPNDAIRNAMLQYFYDRNDMGTSRFGKRGSAVRISDVKRELKHRDNLTQQQVVSNLNYLLDRGWVKEIEQRKEVMTKAGTTIPSIVHFYEISAKGIERIEGGSEFEPRDRYPGININASGSNVITLGDGNIVNVEYRQLFQELSELKERIAEAREIDEALKFDAAVDIETLKDQLAKPKPDREIVGRLWPRIERAANLASLAEVAAKVGDGLGQILS
jgi:vacuolar-type H+-ATPase subunit I/STV1